MGAQGSKIYSVTSFLIVTIVLGCTIADAVFYKQAANGTLSVSQANSLWILNLVVAILLGLFWIWVLIKFLFGESGTTAIKQRVSSWGDRFSTYASSPAVGLVPYGGQMTGGPPTVAMVNMPATR